MNNINNSFGQIERDITKIVNDKIKEIEQKAKQQVASKIPLIQNDIYYQYNLYIKDYILKYFDSIYGATNYNEQSLLNSLNFKNNGFHPDFSYNINFFKWNKDIKNDTDKFNLNGVNDSNYIDESDELDDLEQQDDEDNDNLLSFDYSSFNAKKQFDYYNKSNRQGVFISLKQAYKKAYSEANKDFNNKLYNEIIPNMYKKYGIKLK